jgi:phosphatidylserine/phosphatidylglycerophosphate/cardiolipin synthase-like enzyme
VSVVYHAKKNDTQTLVNEEIIKPLPPTILTPRNTSKIFHHKFIVFSEKQPDDSWKPLKVLSGSTNWTFNGVYQQGNVGHVIEDETIAKTYHDLFTFIKAHPDQTQKKNNIRPFTNANSGLSLAKPISVSFSPRTGKDDLQTIMDAINGAKESMILCSAFDIYEDILNTIRDQPKIVKYGLQNSSSQITGFHRDFSSSFVVPAFLKKGIEGKFKAEITARRKGEGNIFIHLKTIVVDFSTNDPTVITGSHNFSESASEGNDENLICIRGDTDVADVYTIEMFRLYDHYRFRFNQKEAASLGQSTSIKPLAVDNSWLTDYFTPGMLEQRERILFSQ